MPSKFPRFSAALLAAAALFTFAPAAPAWDAHGHRAITIVALERLPADAPTFLKEEPARRRIADQSVVPDRWRSARVAQLKHVNDPDHYIDVEDLTPYGMTLRTLPPLRHEAIRQMTLARHAAGDAFTGRPVNPARDTAKTLEWPGFLPHAIAENYGRLQSAFRTLRILEQLNDPARADQLEMARANVMVQLGILSHYVGDSAQPLHTTHHYNGWIGDNPDNFTTSRSFHAYIDGGVVTLHGLGESHIRDALAARAANPQHAANPALDLDPRDIWPRIIDHIDRSFARVRPLYQLEQSGDLNRQPGKALITTCMADGAEMLASLYAAAWTSSAITERDVQEFLKYDDFPPAAPAPAPATAPAP